MPIQIGTVEGLGLNYILFAGCVRRSEALDLPSRIAPELPEFGYRWVSVFDRGADMSDLDAGCLLDIKARLKPVVTRLAAKGPFQMILVSNSTYNDPLVECWRVLVGSDATYPSAPVSAVSLREACERHGLVGAQSAKAETWIDQKLRSARVHQA